jgi:hypothetical protein
MRQRFWIYTVLAIAALAIACSRPREGAVRTDGQTAIRVTDDELAKYVVWWRDYLELVARNQAELEELRQRISSKYSFAETGRISQDPELLATLDRQRSTMQELDNRRPVDGLKMQALRDTVPGVATLEFQRDKVVYVPGRNEIALAAARQKYGDQFVDWIVARESTIARILSQ